MNDAYRILYVDDEPDNLTAFRAALRRHFHIAVARSGEEALASLAEHPADLVLSDQRMPAMTGVQFLEQVRQRYPQTIRMIVTGYSDMQAVIEAINKSQIYYYITKPWRVDELRLILDRALESHALQRRHEALEREHHTLQLKAARIERENALAQYEILKSQINPHFLFNCMNILASLIPRDPPGAVAFANRFARLYRSLLAQRDQALVPLAEELETAADYLYLQQIRFGDALRIDWQVDARRAAVLPPFSLQLLLENAIKHNVVAEDIPLHITIRDAGDHIEVRNALQRRGDTPAGAGIGLENLSKRYALISGQAIDVSETGGAFTVRLPLIEEI